MDEGLKELKAEFRQLAADWREQMAVGALTAQRVTQVDEKLAELADKVADLDRRLRVAETDHAAKQEAAERSRRASTWISVAVAVVGLVATVVFNVIKAGVT